MKRKWIPPLVLFSAIYWLLVGYGLFQKLMAYKMYPVAYQTEIQAQSEAFALDPYWVMSVVRCESSFRKNACSSQGAIGLMQIMPSTGAWIAEELGITQTYCTEQLYDPKFNIRFGCWYLAFLLEQFDGDTQAAIVAYHAGQGTVEKWLANPEYVDNGRLINIPFPKTKAYWERVESAYNQYRSLYPNLFQCSSGLQPAVGP